MSVDLTKPAPINSKNVDLNGKLSPVVVKVRNNTLTGMSFLCATCKAGTMTFDKASMLMNCDSCHAVMRVQFAGVKLIPGVL